MIENLSPHFYTRDDSVYYIVSIANTNILHYSLALIVGLIDTYYSVSCH